MKILTTLYFYVAYTLFFFRWLVIGRVAVTLLAGRRTNVLIDFFIRFTQPLYNAVRKVFPFTRVPPEKQETTWGLIDGLVPFVLIALLWFVEKLLRILVSVAILNRQ